MKEVDFALEGLNDAGQGNGLFWEVIMVTVHSADGQHLGRFYPGEVEEILKLLTKNDGATIVASETIGAPRADMTCRIQCD